MAPVAAMVSSSTACQPSSSSSWTHGSIPISKLPPSLSFKPRIRIRTRTSFTWLNPQPRAALVEAPPPPPPSPPTSSPRNGSVKVLALPGDRADDLQAEARAMARAANASLYSPQLVASKYGSQPFKVLLFLPKFNSFCQYLLWV